MPNYIVNIDLNDQQKYNKDNTKNTDLIHYLTLCYNLFNKYKDIEDIEFDSSNKEYKEDIQNIIDFIEKQRDIPIDLFIYFQIKKDDNKRYNTNILQEAVISGHIQIVKMILDRVEPSKKTKLINTQFYHEDIDTIKKKKEHEVSITKYTLIDFILKKDDLTEKDFKMFEFLLDNGADINYVNSYTRNSDKNDLHLIMSKYNEYLPDNDNTIEITETEKRIGEIINRNYNSEKNYSHKLPEPRSFSTPQTSAEIFKEFGVEKLKDDEKSSKNLGGKRNKKRTTKRRKINKKKKTASNTGSGGSRYNKSNKKKSGKYAE